MDAARVTAIASGVTVRARAAAVPGIPAGEWREVESNGIVNHREELLVESDFGRYGFAACVLQRRVASVWTNAVTVTLDLPAGSSHFRRDRLSVSGNETNSTIALVTVEQGDALLREGLQHLQRESKARFTLEGSSGFSATRFRGICADIHLGNTAEMGGFEQDFNTVIVAEKEQFQGAEVIPLRGKKLTIAGQTFRQTKVSEDDLSYTIEVASVNR